MAWLGTRPRRNGQQFKISEVPAQGARWDDNDTHPSPVAQLTHQGVLGPYAHFTLFPSLIETKLGGREGGREGGKEGEREGEREGGKEGGREREIHVKTQGKRNEEIKGI